MYRIQIQGAVPRFSEFRFTEPVNWQIKKGENWAVVGPNGAGKTLLMDLLQGRIALKEGNVEIHLEKQLPLWQAIKAISFRDIYSLADCRNMYYQQRWNMTDAETSPWVDSFLEGFPEEKVHTWMRRLGIEGILGKRVVALSSGEWRKFLIAKALMSEPELLILDNPFIGLDRLSRKSLLEMLEDMSRLENLQVVLVFSDPREIPVWIDYIFPLREKSCLPVRRREEFMADAVFQNTLFPELSLPDEPLPVGKTPEEVDYEQTIEMNRVCVRLGRRSILADVDWQVKRGEKWALLGPNGSGKSTLLSLVCGDNPQAYANRISLFGRRRGSGESIWDIKKRIGYLSSDVHTCYLQDIPCRDVVASGFFDSIGLWKKCTEEQRMQAEQWMAVFRISALSARSFLKISYGEQRLVLLARAFVKSPELLILDEPLHGLDAGKKNWVKRVIERFCASADKSLIYVTHEIDEIPACVTCFKEL